MMPERITDMTMQQLEALIRRVVGEEFQLREPTHRHSVDELLDSMWKTLWTPPSDAKSSLEMLREDRDR